MPPVGRGIVTRCTSVDTTNPAVLGEVGKHDDSCSVELPRHVPQVRRCSLARTLRCYERRRSLIALQIYRQFANKLGRECLQIALQIYREHRAIIPPRLRPCSGSLIALQIYREFDNKPHPGEQTHSRRDGQVENIMSLPSSEWKWEPEMVHVSTSKNLPSTELGLPCNYTLTLYSSLWRLCVACVSDFACYEGQLWLCLSSFSLAILPLHFWSICKLVFCLQCFDTVGWASWRDPACKNWVMRCWCGCLSGVRCRLFAYGPADATAIPKPHHLLPQTGFTFLVPAYPGCPVRLLSGCIGGSSNKIKELWKIKTNK